jgi:hypothetical protein
MVSDLTPGAASLSFQFAPQPLLLTLLRVIRKVLERCLWVELGWGLASYSLMLSELETETLTE